MEKANGTPHKERQRKLDGRKLTQNQRTEQTHVDDYFNLHKKLKKLTENTRIPVVTRNLGVPGIGCCCPPSS